MAWAITEAWVPERNSQVLYFFSPKADASTATIITLNTKPPQQTEGYKHFLAHNTILQKRAPDYKYYKYHDTVTLPDSQENLRVVDENFNTLEAYIEQSGNTYEIAYNVDYTKQAFVVFDYYNAVVTRRITCKSPLQKNWYIDPTSEIALSGYTITSNVFAKQVVDRPSLVVTAFAEYLRLDFVQLFPFKTSDTFETTLRVADLKKVTETEYLIISQFPVKEVVDAEASILVAKENFVKFQRTPKPAAKLKIRFYAKHLLEIQDIFGSLGTFYELKISELTFPIGWVNFAVIRG